MNPSEDPGEEPAAPTVTPVEPSDEPFFQIDKVVDQVIGDFWKAVMNNYCCDNPLTGITRFDELTCGLAPGVHILAGRPSMGKTSLLLNMVETMCVEDKLPCLIFSGDLSSLQLTHRLIFSRACLPTRITYAVASYPDESQKASLRRSAADTASSPLFIDDSFDLTVESIQRIATSYKQQKHIGFIAIESLERLRTNFTRIELSREREVVEIVAKLRGLARELEVPILLVAGLNDGPERRRAPLGFPAIEDLPHAHLIMGLASTVSLLYRPAYYAESDCDRESLEGLARLVLCKNEYGITCEIGLKFNERCSRFEQDSEFKMNNA